MTANQQPDNIETRLLEQWEEIRASRSAPPGGGGGGRYEEMEARVAKLEAVFDVVARDIRDIKDHVREQRREGRDALVELRRDGRDALADLRRDGQSDVRELRRDARSDFRILFGAIIAVALGLAGLMAKGFGWL